MRQRLGLLLRRYGGDAVNDFAHSQAANNARTVKADALSRFLLEAGGPWPDTDHDRRVVERAAGVRTSSAETWELARAMYDDVRAHRAVSS